MRTQVMHDPVVATPWLERALRDGQVEKAQLESLPFRIGRHDAADLRIDSTRVSREHAVITRHGKKYHIHDLGSTNGTFLNGQRIDEGVLTDGDQVMIAEVEFTFFSGAPAVEREMPTQVILSAPPHDHEGYWKTIMAVRRVHEAVTRRGLPALFQPIVKLASGETAGHESLVACDDGQGAEARWDHWTCGIESRATDRLRRLCRRRAVEESASLPRGRLFVALAAVECEGAWLVDHLSQLRDLAGESHELVVEIPQTASLDSPKFRSLRTALRESKIHVAYDNYASGKTQITKRDGAAPDYVKLAPRLLRSIRRGGDRQRLVERMIRASQDAGASVIATGVDTEAERDVCLRLKCDLAQGDLFGLAKPAPTRAELSCSERRGKSPVC